MEPDNIIEAFIQETYVGWALPIKTLICGAIYDEQCPPYTTTTKIFPSPTLREAAKRL